ncbi:MAG: endopeptidase La [Bacteroidetes bacterium]|nr:endopeptidase La [Bacteroidota bacterium]
MPIEVELPLLPVRDAVLYPRLVAPLLVSRERSLEAVEEALRGDRTIAIFAQRRAEAQDADLDDLFPVGTEALIGRLLKMPDGTTSVLVQGQRRLYLKDLLQTEPFARVLATPVQEVRTATPATEALMKAVLALFEKCVKMSPNLPEEAYVAAMNVDEPGWLADLVASSLDLELAQRQEILETIDVQERLQKVNILLAKELNVLELQDKMRHQTSQTMDQTQREFFLREQIKSIQKELGDSDPQMREISELREKVARAGMPEEAASKAEDELNRLSAIPTASPEVSVIRNYLDWLASLPWTRQTEDNLDIAQAARVLDENHYGLSKVKERILEYIAVRKLAGQKLRSPILCFVGPPGVGKTSLGQSIAQALGRKFVRISLGGIRDEAEIRGHRRTYVGALPGRIIQTMRNAGTVNPVFMMDEIDKVGMDFRGDPSAALLEVLDPEQNHSFSDHYLDVPYNLSKAMFIVTANILDPVPPALHDRLEVIELPGYTEEEKMHIARQFLVPKQLREHGLALNSLHFSDVALRSIIREYTQEAGLRNLEREIGAICRKVARQVAGGRRAPSVVGSRSLVKYLGPPRYQDVELQKKDQVGVATGLYWTEAGGELAEVEVTLMAGKGNLILTGQLGDVMKESAAAALSYVRSRSKALNLEPRFYEKLDVHIHFPAAATPKEGPSAGITTATALVSALTRRPVRHDVVMTGEITLRGRVLPIGGLKEKALAAHRAGIHTFVLPKRNEKDTAAEIPAEVRRELRFVFVERMDEVLPVALGS